MQSIKLEKTEFTTKITLSKPPLNILDIQDLIELEKFLQDLNNQEKLKLIILESDQKVFSAGVDISEHSREKISELLKAFHRVFFALMDLKVPTLCLVKSGALGGGAELALFCDLVVASENAYFSHPEIKLGCFPPASLVALGQINTKKALEIILTGEKLTAKQALEAGFINHVFTEEEFEEKTQELISSIVSNSSSVTSTTLTAFKKVNYSGLKEKLELSEKIYLEELMELEDSKEGIESFLEKRKAVWKER